LQIAISQTEGGAKDLMRMEKFVQMQDDNESSRGVDPDFRKRDRSGVTIFRSHVSAAEKIYDADPRGRVPTIRSKSATSWRKL